MYTEKGQKIRVKPVEKLTEKKKLKGSKREEL